jgi:hypothetical protein
MHSFMCILVINLHFLEIKVLGTLPSIKPTLLLHTSTLPKYYHYNVEYIHLNKLKILCNNCNNIYVICLTIT